MPEIAEEHRMLQDLVAKFVDEELIPLEKNVLEREASGGVGGLSAEEEAGPSEVDLLTEIRDSLRNR